MDKQPGSTQFSNKHPSIRLPDYDYTQPGAYFITVCTYQRKPLFGNISNRQTVLNENGKIVEMCWKEINNHFSNIEVPAFIIMPNHLHGILVIHEPIAPRYAVVDSSGSSETNIAYSESFAKPVKSSIPTVIRSFKSAATRGINLLHQDRRVIVWQEGYYEHIVRDEAEFADIAEYIIYNPMKWEMDRENPDVINKPKPLPFES